MKSIVIFADYYQPGYRAGGPIVSISRMVAADRENAFAIVTRNHDYGQTDPYDNIARQTWTTQGRARVAYLSNSPLDTLWTIRQLRNSPIDYYYLNGLHSWRFALAPLVLLRLGIIPSARLLCAPRGETSPGALALKRVKKRMYRPLIKALLPKDTVWHVSSPMEEEEVRDWWGGGLPRGHQFIIRPNLAPPPETKELRTPKLNPPVVCFASRIDRKKGLDRALRLLRHVDGFGRFEVHGAITDAAYWEECRQLSRVLHPGDTVAFMGEYEPTQVRSIFANASALLLPTQGENFGHVIAEALSVGCPVIAPPTTPWTAVLRSGGGHVMETDSGAASYLSRLLAMDAEAAHALRTAARSAYEKWYEISMKHQGLFDDLPESRTRPVGPVDGS